MARKLRVQYPGAIYHIMNRGDHRERIFHSNRDRELFLNTLGQVCEKTDWQVHAWCLMSNHFHLVVEMPRGNLVPGMKWLLGTYTMRFNRRHKLFGHLFSGRYKALPVDNSGTGYLKCVCDYAHLNPARAKLLSSKEKLSSFVWSSYPEYLKARSARQPWLRVDRLLGEHGIPKDSAAGRQQFERRMELRRASEDGDEFVPLLRGWCVGSQEFRKELLAQMKGGPEHYGQEIGESAEQKAHTLLDAELKAVGWRASDLATHRKGAPQKVRIALRLRKETTMTLGWIARELEMGTKTHLSHLLYWHGRDEKQRKERRS
ncbi:MAG TPA: transposase [Verrucomicrobiae bacterium]|nr:transposase [Verrucomicrobiae bacterium]